MSISKKKINNLVIKGAPKWGGDDPRPPRGEKLFKKKGCNVYICAKKQSGKTSTLFVILRKVLGPHTKLVVYCATADSDPTWIFIIKFFKSKGINVEVHTSIKENGKDILAEEVEHLKELKKQQVQDEEVEEEELPPKEVLKQKGLGTINAILMHNLPQVGGTEKKKPRRSKYNEREIVWVFDDIATELKSKSVSGLLKVSRHFGCAFISSQWWHDLDSQARAQIDYALIFGGQRDDKLELMWSEFDLPIDFDEFKELYEDATEKPYNFLYIDVRESKFRHNFDQEYNI